jgi:diguanylate cyclase (GGDEF)-like protein
MRASYLNFAWSIFAVAQASISAVSSQSSRYQDFQAASVPRWHHFRAIVGICLAIVLGTLAGGSWFLLKYARQTALQSAEETLQHASLIVESVVNRQLLQVDGALVSLPALFAAASQDGDGVDSDTARRLLRGFNFQAFVFRDIILLRPDGSVWASARPNSWNGNTPIDLAALDSYTRRGAAAVAGPVRNPLTGDWSLFVVRRINVAGAGSLIAMAEVPLPLISSLLAAVGEIPGLHVALERRDGTLLVSQPYNETQIGKRQPLWISLIQANGVPFQVPASLAPRPALGVARVSLYSEVMIALSLDEDTALENWMRDRSRLIGFVGTMAVLLSILALSLDAAHRHRGRADAERNRAWSMLDSAIGSMADGFVMWDSDDRLVTCNQRFREIYDLSAEFIFPGARFEDIIRGGVQRGQYPNVTNDEAFVRDLVAWHRDNNGPLERELPGGRWVLITERRTPGGGTVGIRTDITNLKQTLSDLAAANARAQSAMLSVQEQNAALRERDRALHIQNVLFDAALNNMSQGLLMTDRAQKLIVWNRRFVDLFGLDPHLLTNGQTLPEICAHIEANGRLPAPVVADMLLRQRGLADGRQSGSFLITGDQGFALSVSQRPIADGGWLATYEDVSERHRAEESVRFAAHHDALTQLPNRVLFRIRLDEMIGRLAGHDMGLALLYLDLDRFKHVNDTLGHPIGDALLVAAGRRLLGCLRSDSVVARLGGDEFAVAFLTRDLPASAEAVGERVIAELSAPYSLAGHTVVVGASVGIALAPGAGTDPDTLLKNADMALYQAKARGRGVCSLFEADMERQLLNRLGIEEDLTTAMERNEFEVLYQPLYDLKSERIAGFEALIRWHHPVRGTVSPVNFIQIAEETGLIRAIGGWVLRQACADAMKLPPDVKIAVNLSPAQFDHDDIVDVVADALARSGLPASRLELEITESTLLKNNDTTLALLLRLHAMGLRIALDDFGTGYSSLSYLRSFPFDKIKIDRSFVREMATRTDCAAIVSSIVTLANKLAITTTAEGIETISQLELIREAGCTEAQGYLFSQPRPLAEVLEFFAESVGDHSQAPSRNTGRNGSTSVWSNNPIST